MTLHTCIKNVCVCVCVTVCLSVSFNIPYMYDANNVCVCVCLCVCVMCVCVCVHVCFCFSVCVCVCPSVFPLCECVCVCSCVCLYTSSTRYMWHWCLWAGFCTRTRRVSWSTSRCSRGCKTSSSTSAGKTSKKRWKTHSLSLPLHRSLRDWHSVRYLITPLPLRCRIVRRFSFGFQVSREHL